MKRESLRLAAFLASGMLLSPVWAEFSFKITKKIVFEAEAGKVSAPFTVSDESEASGGKVVYLKEKTNKEQEKKPNQEFNDGSIEYQFTVEAEGDYILWLRKLWMDGCGNSVYCTVNKPMTAKNALVLGEDGTYGKLTWIRLSDKPVHLKAGANVLRIQNREDGIKLDQFAFIEFEDVDGLVPVGKETVTCTPSAE
jgi:hypothetical protein